MKIVSSNLCIMIVEDEIGNLENCVALRPEVHVVFFVV